MSAAKAKPSPTQSLRTVRAQLAETETMERITEIVRRAARELTGADGTTFVLRDGDQCFYADEDAISPLWKGQRFPMEKCVSGWVMAHATPVMIEDIYADPRVLWEAYRPTFIKSLALAPIRRESPLGAIGLYWAQRHAATEAQLLALHALADAAAVAINALEATVHPAYLARTGTSGR